MATALVFIAGNSTAQAFEEGGIYVSAGFRGPNISKGLFSIFNDEPEFSSTGIGPIHGKIEYAISDNIGLGLSLNYVSTAVRWNDPYNNDEIGYDYSALAANIRINFHFLDEDNFDLYYGFGFGYNRASSKFFSKSGNSVQTEEFTLNPLPIGFETTIGGRYMFIPNFGVFAEVGWAKSLAQIGIVGKF